MFCARLPSLSQSLESLNHLLLAPDDADQVLHHFLQIMLHLVRTFGVPARLAGAFKRLQRLPGRFFDLRVVDLAAGQILC